MPREDLEQAGQIGLIKASRRFDPTRKVQFTTFAYSYVSGEIHRDIRDRWQPVKIRRKYYELKNKLREMEAKGLNDREIAIALDLKMSELEELKKSVSCSIVPLETQELRTRHLGFPQVLDMSVGEDNERDPEVMIPELSGRMKDVFEVVCWLQRTTSSAIASQLAVSTGTVRSYLIKLRQEQLIVKENLWYSPNLESVAIAGIRNRIMNEKATINNFIDSIKTLLEAKAKASALEQELAKTQAQVTKLEQELVGVNGNSDNVKWLLEQVGNN